MRAGTRAEHIFWLTRSFISGQIREGGSEPAAGEQRQRIIHFTSKGWANKGIAGQSVRPFLDY
jgi:hypothetical protein